MTSSGMSVQPTVLDMITMELPHIWLISEAISQLIFINDPRNQILEHPYNIDMFFVMPRFL